MRVAAAVCAIVVFSSPLSARADLNMRPGLWESIVIVGGNQMPPDRKCYLPKDIDNLDRFQRGVGPAGQNPCAASDYKAVGNVVSYTLTCAIGGKQSVSAITLSYDGERITGDITGLDGTRSRVVNTRTGDCSESSFGN
jgi:hypothetical protein